MNKEDSLFMNEIENSVMNWTFSIDKLPEKDITVLAYVVYKKESYYELLQYRYEYDRFYQIDDNAFYEITDVPCWMYLPKIPDNIDKMKALLEMKQQCCNIENNISHIIADSSVVGDYANKDMYALKQSLMEVGTYTQFVEQSIDIIKEKLIEENNHGTEDNRRKHA